MDGQRDETRKKLIEMEREHARKVMEDAFDRMPLDAVMGHSDMTMGEAYKMCHLILRKFDKKGRERS